MFFSATYFFLDDIKGSVKEWRFFLCHIIDQFIIETSTELLDVDRFWNTSDELSFKCFKNSFLHDGVVYYSHALVCSTVLLLFHIFLDQLCP